MAIKATFYTHSKYMTLTKLNQLINIVFDVINYYDSIILQFYLSLVNIGHKIENLQQITLERVKSTIRSEERKYARRPTSDNT